MTTMEQMVVQLQQELFTLKAQVAARVQIAAAALEWSAEQMTEISTEFIDREFLPIRTNQERGAQHLEFTLQQMHTVLTDITTGEAKDIVANSRKNLWRRGDDCRRGLIPQREEGRETFFVPSFLRNDALFLNSKLDWSAGSMRCRSTRRSRRIR